jgi:hypothetical protein
VCVFFLFESLVCGVSCSEPCSCVLFILANLVCVCVLFLLASRVCVCCFY